MQKVPGLQALQRFGQQTSQSLRGRAQAPDAANLKPAALQPQAQPVDTYSRPERPPETNSLLQLADTLSAINPALQRFTKAVQPEDSPAAMRAYLQRTPHQQVVQAFKSGNPPIEARTLEGMRVLGEEMAYRDSQEFVRRYNSPDFDKSTGDTDALWNAVSGDTYKLHGTDRAFMEVYTKTADDARRKVMSANMDYKSQEAATARADAVFGAREGRVQAMMTEGKSGDEIAASLFGDFTEKKELMGLHPKDQQKQILQIAERTFNRGQFDVARSLLRYERKDGAYQGSLMTDRDLGNSATELMARIDRQERQSLLASTAAREKENVYQSALKLADQGSVNAIRDVQVHDEQGNMKTISAEVIRTEVARRTLDAISNQANYGAKTPEERAALAAKLEKERFIGNGMEHPVWFTAINAAPGQISLNAVSGKMPPTALDAYKLYKELNAEAPQYLGKYADQKAIDFFEQARAMEETGAADGPEDALLAAFNSTTKIAAPEVLKLRDDDLNQAVDEAINDGWLFDSETGNRGYVQQEIARQARILSRTGLPSADALKRAKEAFSKTHLNVAGTWLANDKRLPTDFKTLSEQFLQEFADKHGDELAIDVDDITIDRLGNGTGSWIVLQKGIRQPLHVPSTDRIITMQTLDALRARNRAKVSDRVIENQNGR